jgi:hypothetical protein
MSHRTLHLAAHDDSHNRCLLLEHHQLVPKNDPDIFQRPNETRALVWIFDAREFRPRWSAEIFCRLCSRVVTTTKLSEGAAPRTALFFRSDLR